MFKKSTIICVFAFTMSLCFAGEKVEISLSDIITKPESFLNKTVTTVGTVDHVCKHGGKKMLIFASTPEESIHVNASDTVTIFNAEINGSDVLVTGIVKENKTTKAQVIKMMSEREEAVEKGNTKPAIEKGEGYGHGEGKAEGQAKVKGEHKEGCDHKAEGEKKTACASKTEGEKKAGCASKAEGEKKADCASKTEGEKKAGCDHNAEGADHKTAEKKEEKHLEKAVEVDPLAQILKDMDASGKDYISSYYIECIEFSVKK